MSEIEITLNSEIFQKYFDWVDKEGHITGFATSVLQEYVKINKIDNSTARKIYETLMPESAREHFSLFN